MQIHLQMNQPQVHVPQVQVQQGQYGQPQGGQWMGGRGGSAHQFAHNTNLCLVGARGRSGASLDQLQLLFRDITTGQFVQSGVYGGKGGSAWAFQAPPGQWIDKIWVQYDRYVQSIRFATNGGAQSRQFGGNGRHKGYHDVSGRRITGVHLKSGGLIDGISFISM